jgi:hypothetical protein
MKPPINIAELLQLWHQKSLSKKSIDACQIGGPLVSSFMKWCAMKSHLINLLLDYQMMMQGTKSLKEELYKNQFNLMPVEQNILLNSKI